ncbi:GMC oxidoreductase family protein [Paraburkholderia xenovorans LB400]|uniref:Glucose-methanol-choline oxidoreductase N-terminal domain-containing protein n=1 Tax=Paraburkholderia xenovorans (strain LB400) TaxID=266265 RepID=Q13GR4_PARXL|nr:hypothetical protein [Paraburkholderia xenovorans]ABE36725.1 hypothetical protein Bxe_C0846 [Paraburkholderia xenovorans LB400]AIP34776.1 GMC oxidoreductase family protein [Paraburkholderia xenovorans LB400]
MSSDPVATARLRCTSVPGSGARSRFLLKSHNINVVADRPGVGKNLTDHPSIAIASYLHPAARRNRLTRRHMVPGWRYSSQIGSAKHNMFAVASGQGAWHAVGKQIGSVLVIVDKTFSNSGEVTLRSADWRDEPSVDFRLLSGARDLERLADGFHRVAALHAYPAVSQITDWILKSISPTTSNASIDFIGDVALQISILKRTKATRQA